MLMRSSSQLVISNAYVFEILAVVITCSVQYYVHTCTVTAVGQRNTSTDTCASVLYNMSLTPFISVSIDVL